MPSRQNHLKSFMDGAFNLNATGTCSQEINPIRGYSRYYTQTRVSLGLSPPDLPAIPRLEQLHKYWDAMDRLQKKDFISDPVGKTKSVAFSKSGLRESQRLLAELFAATDEEG